MEESDYIIVNTCGFLHSSRQESIDAISEAIEDRKSDAKIIVTGCMVQSHSDEIKRLCPEVDYLLGDPSKAKKELGWNPKTSIEDLVDLMIESDLNLAKREQILLKEGLIEPTWESLN